MLEEGVCGMIEELAKRERVDRGYMGRVLRLTLLAPEIVEAILDGRQPEGHLPVDAWPPVGREHERDLLELEAGGEGALSL